MNASKPFFSDEIDSRIMIKKDKAEIDNWTNDLEYINEELEYLLDIEDRMLNNSELYQQLHSMRRDNTLRLGSLYRYEGSMKNALECDTVHCDTYYLNNHEKNRSSYLEHLKKYRNIKSKVLSNILLHATR
ncbi:hypothetical protein JQC67_15920 [Aurantibacter crassamenti]|uniref:hypothetical protein n=1 Tax=Aurantibacter crassamenti TaxID=1837375 RepID=UPI00193A890B|nr:hypothetical protein [Aurantibacter crassamenti]MBM1107644.1 hypothetical protein [Aurantibacter crassamenti]